MKKKTFIPLGRLVFVFDQNEGPYTKAKVSPPRLGGRRLGVFATRSPHRPNNIGLTLAKLESVDREFFSFVDLVEKIVKCRNFLG